MMDTYTFVFAAINFKVGRAVRWEEDIRASSYIEALSIGLFKQEVFNSQLNRDEHIKLECVRPLDTRV